MTNEEVIQDMLRIKRGMRVTKVVATRSIKGRFGDTFLGFSANWDSIQQDGTMGLEEMGDESPGGLNALESQKASLMLGLQVDRAAYLNAVASGNVDQAVADNAIKALSQNYLHQYKTLCEKEEARKAKEAK
jgi:hypothetical protein